MTFLYIGLGIAMISGISAMIQIGNNINNMMLLSTFDKNEYFQSSLPTYDRRIINFLNNYLGSELEVCSKVKDELNDTLYENGELFLSTGTQTPSTSYLFINSCVLVNKDINHRVLINKNNLNNYSLYSCYLKEETFCPFEKNQ